MAKAVSKKRITWGIVLITWPAALLFLTLVFYALANFLTGDAAGSIAVTIVNVLLFVVGALAVAFAIPSIVIGIVLLAMKSLDKPIPEAKRDRADGLSVAGMVLGIVSVATVFFGFITGIISIIFSTIGLKRKPRKNGIGVAGLVLGITGTVIGAIFTIIVFIAGFAIMATTANDHQVRATADSLAAQAQAYQVEHGEYPNYDQLMETIGSGVVPGNVTVGQLGSAGDIIYIPCYGLGSLFWYWNSADEEYRDKTVGDTTYCEVY